MSQRMIQYKAVLFCLGITSPRQQNWTDHFTWSADGTQIEGITGVGRATVLALQLNRAIIVVARRRWVYSGWHPPTD